MPPPAPIVLPRALIFLASIWLIGSWLLAIGLLPPVQPSSSSYAHGLRMMLLCLTTGVMIGWPLLRLSQDATAAPMRQTLLDLLVLASMIQVIVWPLRLVTTWSVLRTAAIDATLVGWSTLAGAAVASAIGTRRRGPRNLAMVGCLAMCLLGPALAYVGALSGRDAPALLMMSPVLSIRALADGGGPLTGGPWAWTAVLYAATAAAWGALIAYTAVRRPID